MLFFPKRKVTAAAGFSVVASGTSAIPSTSGDHSITLPGSPASGHTVLLIWGRDLSISETISTSGYTQQMNPGGSPGFKVFTKRLTGSETSVLVPGDSSGLTPGALLMYIIGGAHATTVWDVTAPAPVTSGSSSTPDPPSITTATNGAMVFAVGLQNNRTATISTFPAGYSNTIQQSTASGHITRQCGMGSGTKIVATAGAENPGTFTFDDTESTLAATFAIRPA